MKLNEIRYTISLPESASYPAPLSVTRFYLNRAIPLERSTARIHLAKRNQTRPENQVQKRMDEKRNTGMGNIVEKYTLGGE